MGLLTLTFDLLTLKLVRELHYRWGTFVPNLGKLGLRVLELAMYATDGRTKAMLTAPFPTGGGVIMLITCTLYSDNDNDRNNEISESDE